MEDCVKFTCVVQYPCSWYVLFLPRIEEHIVHASFNIAINLISSSNQAKNMKAFSLEALECSAWLKRIIRLCFHDQIDKLTIIIIVIKRNSVCYCLIEERNLFKLQK